MIVDLPDPEGPTKALVVPALKMQLNSFRTLTSGFEGYLKFTFSNFISPVTFFLSNFFVPSSFELIYGLVSITEKAIVPATFPSANAE